jgi:molybdenum cofactor guanylyltransferase
MTRSAQGYVLTGGKSSRMGPDKALLPFDGRPLVIYVADVVHRACGKVTLVGSRAKYDGLGLPVIEDLTPGLGPLGGIHTALIHSRDEHSIIVGCDMPYVSSEFLKHLIELAEQSHADVVIPKSREFTYEPLCAVYGAACLPVVEHAIRNGDRKISRVLERVRVRIVTTAEWQVFDSDGRLFSNLNTPEEYQRAVAAAAQFGQRTREN